MVAAILGLSSAAEAGTTRATPSVGVARNRFREGDGAKVANLVSLDPSFIQNLSRLLKAQNIEDSLVRREREESIGRRHPSPQGGRGEWQLLGSRLPPSPVA